MRTGFLQFEPIRGEADETLARVEALLDGADEWELLVLPELANTGYRFSCRDEAFEAASSAKESPLLGLLASRCAGRGSYAVTGFCERYGDRLFNSAALVGPDGVVGVYRKLHLFADEKDIFEPGDLGLPVFDIPGARLGILICFDWMFPETWRSLALDGADIICHPANLVLPYSQRATPVHSMVNRVFIVTANRTGRDDDLEFTGGSQITAPNGQVLASAGVDDQRVAIVDIDPARARDKRITPRNDALRDRRPDQYGRLNEA